MVLALNMMDEVRENGGSIRVNEMEAMLGVPVVPISAAKGEGIDELVSHALHVAHYQERPGRPDFCDPEGPQAAVHRCLHGIMHLIEDHAEKAGIPPRFAASALAVLSTHTSRTEHMIIPPFLPDGSPALCFILPHFSGL